MHDMAQYDFDQKGIIGKLCGQHNGIPNSSIIYAIQKDMLLVF